MRREDGQAIVEFALILPVLLLAAAVILVVSEVGIARLALQHATAEGARAGALTNDDGAIRETLAAAVAPLAAGRVAVEIEPRESEAPRNADPRGALLTVRARYEIPLPLGAVGVPGISVVASASRRIEWTP